MQKINWNEVYRKQAGTLTAVAYRYIRERRQAEDLVQDAFIVAIEKTDRFSGKGAFEAWLRKVVVNECLMYLRKSKLKTEDFNENLHTFSNELQMIDEENDWYYADDPDKRKVIERCNFSREDLLDIATQLPEHHRLTFNMYVIDGFSYKEISTQLNICEGTLKSHLNRARKRMQDLLYTKALDMQKKKEKKKRLLVAVWFGVLFGKTSVVDAMHLKAFSDFKVLAPPPSAGLEQAILSTSAASAGLSTTAIAIIAGCVGLVGGIGGTIGVLEHQKHRANLQHTIIEHQIYEVLETPDFIDYSEYAEQPITPLSTPEPEPVFETAVEEKSDVAEEKNDVVEKEDVTERPEPEIVRRTIQIFDTIFYAY